MATREQLLAEARREREAADRAKTRAASLEAAAKRLETSEPYGPEPTAEGTVVVFHALGYWYAAVRNDQGQWHCTGPSFKGPYTWQSLSRFVQRKGDGSGMGIVRVTQALLP